MIEAELLEDEGVVIEVGEVTIEVGHLGEEEVIREDEETVLALEGEALEEIPVVVAITKRAEGSES